MPAQQAGQPAKRKDWLQAGGVIMLLPDGRVRSLTECMQDVNATLQSHDTQNIDMSLAMSLEERGSTSLHAPLDDRPTARYCLRQPSHRFKVPVSVCDEERP